MNRAEKVSPKEGGPAATAAPGSTPTWITPELIALTLRVWQPLYPDRLTRDDAIAMLLAVGRLFLVLSGEQAHEAVRRTRSR